MGSRSAAADELNALCSHPRLVLGSQEEAVLDDVIDRLLDVRNGRPGKQVQLTEQEIRQLCLTAKEIFMSQPNLLELEAPIKICGETLPLLPACTQRAA
jgi:hypothetical protein